LGYKKIKTNPVEFYLELVVDEILFQPVLAALEALCVDERGRRERCGGAFDALTLRLEVLLLLAAHPADFGQVGVDGADLLRPLRQQARTAFLRRVAPMPAFHDAAPRVALRPANRQKIYNVTLHQLLDKSESLSDCKKRKN